LGSSAKKDSYGRQFAANLDEVRIEIAERSSNWVCAVGLNITSNSVFNSYAPPVVVPPTSDGWLFEVE
jgi:hypothetical protein